MPLISGDGPLVGAPDVRRRNDAGAAEISSPHTDVAAAIVVDGPLTNAGNECVGALPVPEDEPGLGSSRAREDHPRATVIAVRVVVGIVVDDDPEAHACVIVRAPERIAHVAVAVIAQEAGVVIVLLHVIRHDVIVPIVVAVRHDALGEVRQRDVRVTAHSAIRDRAVVPVLVALERVVDEGVGGGDGKDVADSWIVVDIERISIGSALHLVLATAAGEVVLPWRAREQDANASISVDSQDGDIGVPVGAEMHARTLAALIRVVAPIGPDFDAGAIGIRGWLPRGEGSRAGHGQQAEQAERGQHTCLRRARGAGTMPRGGPGGWHPSDCRY